MKRFILIIAIIATGISAYGQYGVENILRKYKNDKGVMSMNVEGDFSNFFHDNGDESVKSTIEAVNFIVFQDGGDLSDSDRSKLKSRIKDDQYETLVQASDNGNRVNIMGISNEEHIEKLFANVKADKYNVYVIITGQVFFDEISKLNLNNIESFVDKF